MSDSVARGRPRGGSPEAKSALLGGLEDYLPPATSGDFEQAGGSDIAGECSRDMGILGGGGIPTSNIADLGVSRISALVLGVCHVSVRRWVMMVRVP